MDSVTAMRLFILGTATLGAAILFTLSFSAASRKWRRDRFCTLQKCQLDAAYTAQFAQRSDRGLRINAGAVMVAGALAAALPIRRLEASGTSSFAFILILISSTAVASAWLALSATGRFDAIETTAPVARSRAVTLADYVAPRRRAANWIGSGLALLLATGAVVAQQMTSRLDGLATGALVGGVRRRLRRGDVHRGGRPPAQRPAGARWERRASLRPGRVSLLVVGRCIRGEHIGDADAVAGFESCCVAPVGSGRRQPLG